jgi:membrane associated rhomboid family serine protease
MSRYHAPENNSQPVMWLGGYALYAAHAIVLVYVVSMLVTTGCMAAGFVAPFNWLPYTSHDVLRGQVWRIFTYGFLNPPSIPFVVDMFMIAWFGRELEKHFGRRTFLQFYAGLYFLSPLLFTLIGLWFPMSLSGETGGFALFIAFATLYPGVALFFGILAQWLAFILVGIYTLMALASRNVTELISLWATVGFAHGFVRYEQGRLVLPHIRGWFKRPKLRVLPDLPTKPSAPRPSSGTSKSMQEMDALLDKIAQSGFGSLTASEREQLEHYRAEILRKQKPGSPSGRR